MKNYILIFLFLLSFDGINAQGSTKKPPNIIFILADDLSWGDLGCYGQKKIKTPNIDRIAVEGMKFTQAYAGSSVCAPSRSALMEGLHPGHMRVRSNEYKVYRESLQEGDFTVAMLLQQAGYKTGLFGKWGLGNYNQPGIPNKMGFDEFYGYLNQRQAHCYYPEFLYHNQERIYFPENGDHYREENYSRKSNYDENGKVVPWGVKDPAKAKYSFDLYSEKTLEFIQENKDNPFFLFLAYTLPHGPLIVPELGVYKNEDWPIQYKEWAAMITRLDTQVGKVLTLINDLGLDENTIIFFASDNGFSAYGYEGRYLREKDGLTLEAFFNLSSPTKGRKGDTFNGAFHVPALVRWPGHIKPGQVSDHIWAFWDFMPTAAAIAGVNPPRNTDGISILPALIEKGKQKQHDFLYWEFKNTQMVRTGKWFSRRPGGDKHIELYDLEADPQQNNDLSASNPNIVKRIARHMDKSHTPGDVWPSPGETEAEFNKRIAEKNIPPRPNNLFLY
ncbi:MAG TPA: arylsulfatase [Flavitalea sp.]|nr:arylsulfatase [Flavitalea sp.]